MYTLTGARPARRFQASAELSSDSAGMHTDMGPSPFRRCACRGQDVGQPLGEGARPVLPLRARNYHMLRPNIRMHTDHGIYWSAAGHDGALRRRSCRVPAAKVPGMEPRC